MPQYYDTCCLICNDPITSPAQHDLCNKCARLDTDIVPEYIYKLQNALIDIRAMCEGEDLELAKSIHTRADKVLRSEVKNKV